MTQVTAKNVAIICPTKNQPTKVLRLLESIVHLDEMPQQIIIADGGRNLKPFLTAFYSNSILSRLYCPEIGQIMQRNHAHAYLDKSIKLVLHLDDDTTLEPDSISEMISFWNEESKNQPSSCRRLI